MKETEIQLAALREKFKTRLETHLLELETLSKGDDFSDQTQEKLIFICHKLAGSAGTFGFAQVSSEMRQIDQRLINPQATDTDLKQALNAAIRVLKTALS